MRDRKEDSSNPTPGDLAALVRAAHSRIAPYIEKTPLQFSGALSRRVGSRVYLKLENLQHTGSFKVRGAVNKLLNLSDDHLKRGVITASTGNHALAVAYAAKRIHTPCTVVLPVGSGPFKIGRIMQYGPRILFHGADCAEAETHARMLADRLHQTYVSPYNDPYVAAGQGTIAVELENTLGPMEELFVSVGGGGLISGVGAYLKQSKTPVLLT